ncbi:hypothetical protein GJ697_13080 [Pseudoduganella sp. FT25W]|uniref:DUF1640 domain-containing protein n=1 Tax=Duganella alba TaxID=2666081 RepID=A0A6L5QIH4_9BURK|nr:hypothetical protein [Duganella alba]MRX08771.1 hypothetical protein [Duganella alba]MRX18741.1 hypothetical protein [Duganella alba]
MANDKSMELRVALQEHQMETLVEIVRDIQANYVTKAELKESLADFKSYVDQRFASKEDLARFATKEDLLRFATKEDLARFATKEDLLRFATKEDLARFATKEDLLRFATKEDLAHFATKEDLLRFATKEDLSRFATKEDLSHFATKEDLERAQQSTRNWMITVMLSVTALQFAMQYAMFQLYTQIR